VKRALLLLFALLGATLIACGGGDDTDDGDNGGNSDAQPSAAATEAGDGDDDGDDDGGNDGDSDSDDGGSASIIVGDESYTFSVECSFGTGIIRGAGAGADGTPAFLQASMPVNSAGAPANDPSGVSINVYVGRTELIGSSDYEYWVNETAGAVTEYTDNGEAAAGTAQFQYRDKNAAKEGLTYGELVDGRFQATCP
jgi:hypothetical protein